MGNKQKLQKGLRSRKQVSEPWWESTVTLRAAYSTLFVIILVIVNLCNYLVKGKCWKEVRCKEPLICFPWSFILKAAAAIKSLITCLLSPLPWFNPTCGLYDPLMESEVGNPPVSRARSHGQPALPCVRAMAFPPSNGWNRIPPTELRVWADCFPRIEETKLTRYVTGTPGVAAHSPVVGVVRSWCVLCATAATPSLGVGSLPSGTDPSELGDGDRFRLSGNLRLDHRGSVKIRWQAMPHNSS